MSATGLRIGDLVLRVWTDHTSGPRGKVLGLRGRGPSRAALVRWEEPLFGQVESWTALNLLGVDAVTPDSSTERAGNVGPTVATAGTSFHDMTRLAVRLPSGTRIISGYDGSERDS